MRRGMTTLSATSQHTRCRAISRRFTAILRHIPRRSRVSASPPVHMLPTMPLLCNNCRHNFHSGKTPLFFAQQGRYAIVFCSKPLKFQTKNVNILLIFNFLPLQWSAIVVELSECGRRKILSARRCQGINNFTGE